MKPAHEKGAARAGVRSAEAQEADPAPRGRLFSLGDRSPNPFLRLAYGLADRTLGRALAIERLNRVYHEIPSGPPIPFVESSLARLGVTYEVAAGSPEDIPSEGALVVVCNHPFGIIDPCVLLHLLTRRREDVKILANHFMLDLTEMREMMIPIDPFGTRKAKSFNLLPLREGLGWIKKGGVLGVFPAGEVAHYRPRERAVVESAWIPTTARLVRQAQVPVLPLWFDGRNSRTFYLAGLVHPLLRTILLPRELLKKQSTTFRLRIGKVLTWKQLEEFQSPQQLAAFLQLYTEILRYKGRVKPHHYKYKRRRHRKIVRQGLRQSLVFEEVAPQKPIEALRAEYAALPSTQRLAQGSQFEVCYAKTEQIPLLLHEIGRQRELAFRAVKEGSGKAVDLDDYDAYYEHLILWSKKDQKIAGAYRMCKIDEVLARHGPEGFYLSTLFRLRPEFFRRFANGVEMGRSFICQEYQRAFPALMLLWKAIARYMIVDPRYRYLVGPVSISQAYQTASVNLIRSFLLVHHSYTPSPGSAPHASAGSMLRRRNAPLALPSLPPPPLRGVFKRRRLIEAVPHLGALDMLLSELNPEVQGIPVLLRQYLWLGGKVLGFNLDPVFSNVIDGLVMVDMLETKPSIMRRFMGTAQAEAYLNHHGRSLHTTPEESATPHQG